MNYDLTDELVERLTKWRLKNHYNYLEAAECLGVSDLTVRRWEDRKVKQIHAATYRKLMAVLDGAELLMPKLLVADALSGCDSIKDLEKLSRKSMVSTPAIAFWHPYLGDQDWIKEGRVLAVAIDRENSCLLDLARKLTTGSLVLLREQTAGSLKVRLCYKEGNFYRFKDPNSPQSKLVTLHADEVKWVIPIVGSFVLQKS